MSTEPCTIPGGSCTATNTSGGCSGLQVGAACGDACRLCAALLAAVESLLNSAPRTFSTLHCLCSAWMQGLVLPGQGDADSWPAGGSPYPDPVTILVLPLLSGSSLPAAPVQFELHVRSTFVPAAFAVTDK